MTKDEKGERGFTVVDKRGSSEPEAAARPDAGDAASESPGMPEIDFSSFTLSLGSTALYHLGMLGDTEDGKPAEPNLPMARQIIDTIAMLQQKTRGNLDEQEAQLVENLLYELRMRFVEADPARRSTDR